MAPSDVKKVNRSPTGVSLRSLSLQIGAPVCPWVCVCMNIQYYIQRCFISVCSSPLSCTGFCVTACVYRFFFLQCVFCICAENRRDHLISASSWARGLWRNEVSALFYSHCSFNLLSPKNTHSHTHKHKSHTASEILFKGAFKIAKCPDNSSVLIESFFGEQTS